MNLPHTGDLEMWLPIAAVSGIGRVDGPPRTYRRIYPNSMLQTTYPYNSTADLEQRLSPFENVFIRAKAFVPNGDSLFAAARKALAASALECVRSAYDCGRSSEEPVEDYMAFAVRVWPGVNKTWRWRLLARCAAVDDSWVNDGCAAALRVAAGLRWRVWRWRLRWTGV